MEVEEYLESADQKISLVESLQVILKEYLKQRPQMSLNGLSKKCSVSEPTLRRIMKGQIKTLPNITIVLDILTYINNEKNILKITKTYPGPIADYLKEMLTHSMDCRSDYDISLNNELKNPTKYLIYKLASNTSGVTHQKILDLFGSHGLMFANDLIEKDFIECRENIYFSKSHSFTVGHEDFNDKFKAVSEFIKTQKIESHSTLNPLFVNYSNSVSAEAYKEVISLQRKTLKKIRTILSDDKSVGEIPLFLLLAVDTLDHLTADQIENDK